MASETSPKNSLSLTKTEHATNIVQGLLLGAPAVGASLERLVFGPFQELRMKRIDQTVAEIAAALRDRGEPNGASKEEFAEFFDRVGPSIVRETTETKRRWFRDLLLNVALTPSGDPAMEEARLAIGLIEQINPPGLEIIARLNTPDHSGKINVLVLDEPASLAVWPADAISPSFSRPLSYGSVVVEEAVRPLKGMHHVVNYSDGLNRPTSNSAYANLDGYDGISLTKKGRLLVKWGMADIEGRATETPST